ncbi:MAG: pantoate--beta-alanine ligase [Phycisphaerae bacterium]
MQETQTIAECRGAVAAARKAGRRIGFVPTMGGLHRGHASLIQRAREAGDWVVVSIFVNPTQFGPGEDFSAYPRAAAADALLAREAGCDLLLCPSTAEIYPPGDQTRVVPGALADGLCGPFRPGHFVGVCTVVAKLFGIVQPDRAYFGQKDAQQARIIARMTADLCLPIAIEVCPIVREADGLACSTRNQYLSAAQRAAAASVPGALQRGAALIAGGERRAGRIVYEMRRVLDAAGPCTVDYIAVVDPQTLEARDPVEGPVLLALAVRIGTTRLIDNLPARPPQSADVAGAAGGYTGSQIQT